MAKTPLLAGEEQRKICRLTKLPSAMNSVPFQGLRPETMGEVRAADGHNAGALDGPG
jgi:hypothetical protein